MKTDFTERLRNFLKEEGVDMRVTIDFDTDGKVEMINATPKCSLSDEKLLRKVDDMTNEMYGTGETPNRNIFEQLDSDYYTLVRELVARFQEKTLEGNEVSYFTPPTSTHREI